MDTLGTDVDVCLYLSPNTAWPCVLQANREAVERCDENAESCVLDGGAMEWTTVCPGDPVVITVEEDEVVPASLALVQSVAGQELGCPAEVPASCNASTEDVMDGGGCIARIAMTYVVNENGEFDLQGESNTLEHSGFLREDLGLASDAQICASLSEPEQCSVGALSCNPATLEVNQEGVGEGQIRVERPQGDTQIEVLACESESNEACRAGFPTGRKLRLFTEATGTSVLTSVEAGAGAGDDCDRDFFTETATVTEYDCEVALTADASVTVNYGYPLFVTVNGQGSVSTQEAGADADGFTCAFDANLGPQRECLELYDESRTVNLTATPDNNDWKFTQWVGGPCNGTTNPVCTVTMDQVQTVTAVFGFQIILRVTGGGEVTDGEDNRCTAADEQPCRFTYSRNAQVSLTATPSERSVVAEWAGACEATNPESPCALTLETDLMVGLDFAYEVRRIVAPAVSPAAGTLTIEDGPDGPDAPCRSEGDACGAYKAGRQVSFTGTPADGWIPLLWTGCDVAPGQTTCTTNVQTPLEVTAEFGHELSLDVPSPTNVGTVSVMPSGAYGTCSGSGRSSGNCNEAYPNEVQVTLTATPLNGWGVFSWDECPAPAVAPESNYSCRFRMSANRAVTASLGPVLTTNIVGDGTVTSDEPTPRINCTQDCPAVTARDSEVILHAEQQLGAAFVGWTGQCTPIPNTRNCRALMDGPKEVTATFGRNVRLEVTGPGTVETIPATAFSCTGTDNCTQAFGLNQMVTFRAQANQPNWGVVQWSGCSNDPVLPTQDCEVTVNNNRTVTVEFGPRLQIAVEPAGTGRVDYTRPADGTGTSCTGICDVFVPPGTPFSLLRATPNPQVFVEWSAPCSNLTGVACNPSITAPTTVTANFGHNTTVDLGPTGESPGTVASIGSGTLADRLDCPGTCAAPFKEGTSVTLQATPVSADWDVLSWGSPSECAQIGNNNRDCTIDVDAAKTIDMDFGRPLIVNIGGNGSVTGDVTCSAGPCPQVFTDGQMVILQATSGVEAFGGWEGCDPPQSGDPANRCRVAMNGLRSVTANFGTGVNIQVSAGGTVLVDAPGTMNDITCSPPSCNVVVSPGGTINLTAVPESANPTNNGGYALLSWGGECVGEPNTQLTCSFTTDANAQFVDVTFGRRLNVTLQGGGRVLSNGGVDIDCPDNPGANDDCDQVYAENAVVTLQAVPDPSFILYEWSANCTSLPGDRNRCSVNMNAAQQVTATFGRQVTLTAGTGGTVTPVVTSGGDGRPGLSCGQNCFVFVNGSVVRFDAQPDNNDWAVLGWSGDCTPGQPRASSCTQVMGSAAPYTISVDFGRPLDLTGPVAVSAGGAVTESGASPQISNCRSNNSGGCSGVYADGSFVTLTINPDPNYEFYRWTTGCLDFPTPGQCRVQMRGRRQPTVQFGRALEYRTRGDGNAGLAISEAPASCASTTPGYTCNVYPDATQVTFNPVPNLIGGWQFVEWTGTGVCTPSTNPTCSFTLVGETRLTLDFGLPLIVSVTGNAGRVNTPQISGDAIVDCTATSPPANCVDTYATTTTGFPTVRLQATRASATDNTDAVWSVMSCATTRMDQAVNSDCDVELNSLPTNRTVDLTFSPALTVNGTGLVAVESITGGPINCTGVGTCSDRELLGAGTHTLSVNGLTSQRQVGSWTLSGGATGTCLDGAVTCTVTISDAGGFVDVAVEDVVFELSVTVGGGGTATLSPADRNGDTQCTPGFPCTFEYTSATMPITVTAEPNNSNFEVLDWTTCPSLAMDRRECTFSSGISANTAVGVSFGRPVAFNASPNGGTVMITNPNPNTGVPCTQQGATDCFVYPSGTDVALQAQPATDATLGDWVLRSWSGACAGSGLDCTLNNLNMGVNTTAEFGWPLEVVVTGGGGTNGTVSSGDMAIDDCGAGAGDCNGNYADGSSAVLSQNTVNGFWRFASWPAGFGCSGPGDCTIPMNRNRTGANAISVAFDARLFVTVPAGFLQAGERIDVTLVSDGSATGANCVDMGMTTTCTGQDYFPVGTQVRLTATANMGRTVSWGATTCEAGSTANECLVTINAPINVIASFL